MVMRMGALSFILMLQVILAISLQEPVSSLHLQKLSYFSSSGKTRKYARDGGDKRYKFIPARQSMINGDRSVVRSRSNLAALSSSPSLPFSKSNVHLLAHLAGSKVIDDSFNSWAPFSGLLKDIKRRAPQYRSDWIDGFRKRTIGASLFLYFTCLAPVVAFGGIANLITEGSIGVIEFIVSSGIAGIIYAIFAGQPMAFLGPTGLTLAFISTLYRYSVFNNVPFLEVYSWTGIWTSLFLSLASIFNLANLLSSCTRFTDDCFNALLSINFLYEAFLSLGKNFISLDRNMRKAFSSLVVAIVTAVATSFTASFEQKHPHVPKKVARVISSFGPSMVVIVMSIICASPYVRHYGFDRLAVPETFSLATLINRLPNVFSLPINMRLRCMIPAFLLTMLFYLDQNISIRTVNGFKMKKGEAYHLDMFVLAGVVFVLSVSGLPWVCGATVQSLNHVRAMANVRKDENDADIVDKIIENRLSGFLTHTLLLSSVLLLPYIEQIPIPVISGIFLFLGTKLMSGNQFLERLGSIMRHPFNISRCSMEGSRNSVFKTAKPSIVAKYVSIQAAMLTLIWVLKSTPSLSIFFPACIALLMITRVFVLPVIFSKEDLQLLDSAELEL